MSGAARWRVRPGDGERLCDVLARMGDVARGAAEEGRAFVDGKRAGGDEAVRAGCEVVVYAARAAGAGDVKLLFFAGGIAIADKPADLPTTPDRRGGRSLIGEVAAILGVREREVHAASRLDVGVSGAVLCATGEGAQRHVAAMREAGRIHRVYVGIAGGEILGEGAWCAPIGRASERGGRSRPVVGGKDAEPAETRFRAIAHARGARGGRATLVRFEPVTGRMHQIRVHAAAAGAALLGDREHGGARSIVAAGGRVIDVGRIVLHALRVELPGERDVAIMAISPVPDELVSLWKALDGDVAAWDDVALAPEPPPARV